MNEHKNKTHEKRNDISLKKKRHKIFWASQTENSDDAKCKWNLAQKSLFPVMVLWLMTTLTLKNRLLVCCITLSKYNLIKRNFSSWNLAELSWLYFNNYQIITLFNKKLHELHYFNFGRLQLFPNYWKIAHSLLHAFGSKLAHF